MRRKRRKNGLAQRLETALELPDGTLHRTLRVELSGNRRAVIDGCRRILQYDEDCIRLDTVEGVLCFVGESLRVNCLSAGSAVVTGRFATIGYS